MLGLLMRTSLIEGEFEADPPLGLEETTIAPRMRTTLVVAPTVRMMARMTQEPGTTKGLER